MLATLLCFASQHVFAQVTCEASRERRVLDLLCSLERDSAFHLWTQPARFARAHSAIAPDCTYPVAVYDRANCGDEPPRSVDLEQARRVAAELFATYGIEAQPMSMRSFIASVDFDLVALDGALAFEIREPGASDDRTRPDESLEAAELDELHARGWRVHVLDAAHFSSVPGDSFTPMTTFAAGVVEFLNEVTDGEDVSLDGLLCAARLDVAPLGVDTGSGRWQHDGRVWVLNSDGTPLRFEIDAQHQPCLNGIGAERGANHPGSRSAHAGRGAPSSLTWSPTYSAAQNRDGSSLRVHRFGLRALTVRQTTREGREVALTSNSFAVLLPSEFDVTQPLQVEMDLEPGTFVFDAPLRIGFAPRCP